MDSDYFTDDRDALLTQLQEELDGIIPAVMRSRRVSL